MKTFQISNGGETVPLRGKIYSLLLQPFLPPFMAVDAKLNCKGKPGLNPDGKQPHIRVNKIVIQT